MEQKEQDWHKLPQAGFIFTFGIPGTPCDPAQPKVDTLVLLSQQKSGLTLVYSLSDWYDLSTQCHYSVLLTVQRNTSIVFII